MDNVTRTVGNVSVSISEQSELLSTAIPAFLAWFLLTIGAFSCNALDFYFFCEFWSLPDHVNSCVLQPIPASALQCLVKSPGAHPRAVFILVFPGLPT